MLCKHHKIESIYVKLILPKNVIFGCIYRHPDNIIDYFKASTENYLKNQQKTFLHGEFNTDF